VKLIWEIWVIIFGCDLLLLPSQDFVQLRCTAEYPVVIHVNKCGQPAMCRIGGTLERCFYDYVLGFIKHRIDWDFPFGLSSTTGVDSFL